VINNYKDGYESDVTDIEEEEEEANQDDPRKKFKSVRSFYKDGVDVYIVDALKAGNIGTILFRISRVLRIYLCLYVKGRKSLLISRDLPFIEKHVGFTRVPIKTFPDQE